MFCLLTAFFSPHIFPWSLSPHGEVGKALGRRNPARGKQNLQCPAAEWTAPPAHRGSPDFPGNDKKRSFLTGCSHSLPTERSWGRAWEKLTLHLCLVDQQELGGAAALELLGGAFVGAELLVLAFVQREQRAGKAAAAHGARQRCQREFLQRRAQGIALAPPLLTWQSLRSPYPPLLGSVGWFGAFQHPSKPFQHPSQTISASFQFHHPSGPFQYHSRPFQHHPSPFWPFSAQFQTIPASLQFQHLYTLFLASFQPISGVLPSHSIILTIPASFQTILILF